ncbi:MAG: hemerythrin family protein [Treponema sp.]|jgi:hemerythrin-like metal-binding protein|nr:hemerythrin family protein [Treponema sp.]
MEKQNSAEWDNRYLTGIEKLDDQHRELVRMIGNIPDGKDEEETGIFLRQNIFRLIQYLKFHFGEEERFMEKIGYPDLAVHTKQHEKFMEELLELVKRTGDDNFFSPAAIIRYLKDSILAHIALIDKKYATFNHVLSLQAGTVERQYQPVRRSAFWHELQNLPTEAFIG